MTCLANLCQQTQFPIRLPWKQSSAWNPLSKTLIKMPSTRRDVDSAVSVLMGLEGLEKNYIANKYTKEYSNFQLNKFKVQTFLDLSCNLRTFILFIKTIV